MRSSIIARFAFVGVVALSASASADVSLPSSGAPVMPRVFVIIDSSTSMKQDPAYKTNGAYWPNDDTQVDPDVDPLGACRSKYCIAKNVMYDVLRSHTSEVRLGVASYYQYLVKFTPVDGQQTRCWYDAMYKPNTTLYYPNNGTTSDRFAGVTTVGDVANNIDLSGRVGSQQRRCTTPHLYDLTVVSASNAPQTCTTYKYKTNPGAFIANENLGSCVNGQSYGAATFAESPPTCSSTGVGCLLRTVPEASSCPAAVDPMTITGATTPDAVVTNVATTCGSPPCWQTNFFSTTCSASNPCNLYSAGEQSATPDKQSWYGFFQGGCGGGPNIGPGTPFNCINPSPATWPAATAPFAHASRLDSAEVTFSSTVSNLAACPVPGHPNNTLATLTRVTDNGLRSRFMMAADYTAARTTLLPAPGGYTATTPSNNCTGNWPCDITLTAATPVAQPDTVSQVGHCPSPLPFGATCGASGTFGPGTNYQLLKPAAGSCPALTGPYGDVTPLPNASDWGLAPTCGVGNNQCTLVASATPTVADVAACAANVTRWDGAVEPTCTYLSRPFAYTAGPLAGPFDISKEVAQTATCPADGSDAKNNAVVYNPSTAWGGDLARLASCRGGTGPCTLSGLTETPSASLEWSIPVSAWAPSDPSFTGTPTQTADATNKIYASPPCTAYTAGAANDPSAAYDLGASGVGVFETTESVWDGETFVPSACRFQKVLRSWSRPKKLCNYKISSTTFTTANAITWCQYNRLAYQLTTPVPDRFDCTYQSTLRRFDFVFAGTRVCRYYRLQTQGTRDVYSFIYSYQTKGGEFAGASSHVVTGDKTNVATLYPSFQADCPATWDECLGGGTNTKCYLRNNGSTGVGFVEWTKMYNQPNSGRFLSSAAGPVEFSNAALFPALSGPNQGKNPGSENACIAADYASPPVTEPARARYTVKTGAIPGSPQYKLVSDYFDCSDPNNPATCATTNIADLNSDVRAAPTQTLNPSLMAGGPYQPLTGSDWTSAGVRAYGFSGTGPTYGTPSQMFLGFPADSDLTGNLGPLKQFMSRCVRPSTANVTGMTWAGEGVCMADLGSPNGDGKNDFTPLYGSLQNVRQYIKDQLQYDSTFTGPDTCRPYFVILASDGAENTPAHYADEHLALLSSTQLESAVNDLRTVSDGTRTMDVKTYVVGFGDATADPAAAALLNAMAVKGGTTGAFFAADRPGLIAELNRVFSGILMGTYSRSKPVLSTDGKNIYASQFDRAVGTPEWKGRFFAYGVAMDGTLSLRWELSDKLDNAMTDGERTLYTDIPAVTPRTNFVEGNASLNSRLTAHTLYPGAMNPDSLVKFVRNASKNEPYFSNPAKRGSRLNAIIHAAPVNVGRSPLPSWWGGPAASASLASYPAFQAAHDTREERVIVGASDGLLRAMRENTGVPADDGKEAWGWVPSLVQDQLFRLKQGTSLYNGMDGQLAVADVCAEDDADGDARNCAMTNWKTLSVASTGQGGRGLMALDVTDPTDPKKMWAYKNTSDMGYAVSTPVIGRVQLPTKDIYLTVFGGGTREQGADGPLSEDYADGVYMLNAVSGNTVAQFNATGEMAHKDIFTKDNQFYARPSFWQRPGSPYMDHAMFATTNGRLYVSRFRDIVKITAGVVDVAPITDSAEWEPKTFFDPTRGACSKSPTGVTVQVRRVLMDNTDPSNPIFSQATSDPINSWTGESLPLSRNLPIYVRPRFAAVQDPGKLIPDYFVGTGDGLMPGNPRPEFVWNYFYAVHDNNKKRNGETDGAPLWVNQFIHKNEQVVSEPAMINGAIIVATYLPPTTTSPCENAGDARFYCFNPLSGDLVKCLVNSDSTLTSVRTYSGVGIPSDLVTVGENLFWTASNVVGPPNKETVKATLDTGDIRSWRRIR